MRDREPISWIDFFQVLFPCEIRGLIEVRQIPAGGGSPHSDWFPSVEALAARSFPTNHNVYFSPITRSRHGGRKKADTDTVYALYADVDLFPDSVEGMSLEAIADEFAKQRAAFERDLKKLELKPTAVVFTGGGFHLYWALDSPYRLEGEAGAADPSRIRRIESLLRNIAARLNADPVVAEVARVMRLPETLNYPGKTKQAKGRTKPEETYVVGCQPELRYSIEWLEEFFGTPPPPMAATGGDRTTKGSSRKPADGRDARKRRWSRDDPCPVCGGDQQTQGDGRCYGLLSEDGRTAFCTQSDGGGRIEGTGPLGSFAHSLGGVCVCGSNHGPARHVEMTTAGAEESDRLAPVPDARTFQSLDALHDFATAHAPRGAVYRRHFDYRDELADEEPRLRVYRYENEAGEKEIRQASRRSDGSWQFAARGVGRLVYNLRQVTRAIEKDQLIWIVEGEKDADQLSELGLVATTYSGGAVKNRGSIEHLADVFIGARVVVVVDHDESGRLHALNVLNVLDPVVMSLRCRAPREEADTCDAVETHGSDWWCEFDVKDLHGDKRMRRANLGLKRLLQRGEDESGLPPINASLHSIRLGERIRIQVDQDFRGASIQLADALAARNRMHARLFRVGTSIRQVVGPRSRGRLAFAPVTAADQRKLAEDVALFQRTSDRGLRESPPDRALVGAAFSRLLDELDECVGITWDPLMNRDGSLLVKSGYDEHTRLLVVEDPDLALASIPDRPSASDVSQARSELETLLFDVAFATEADKASFIAALFTLVLRPSIEGPVPVVLVDAPTPGSGKSEAIKILSMLATGEPVAMASPQKSEEELQKQLFSYCLAGKVLVAFDNWKGRVDSETIAAYATSTRVSGRILGASEAPDLEVRMMMAFTGNNLTTSREIERRSIRIRLDTKRARPESREFKHLDICDHIRINRGRLLAAVLMIARAGFQRNESPRVVFPGFPAWSRVIGPILEVGEWTAFDEMRQEIREDVADDDSVWFWLFAWLYETWPKAREGFTGDELRVHIQSDAQTRTCADVNREALPPAGETARRTQAAEVVKANSENSRPELPEKLQTAMYGSSRQLGYVLRGVRDVVREGPDGRAFRIVKATGHHGSATSWKIERL